MVFFPSFCRPKIPEILPEDVAGIEAEQRKKTLQQGEGTISNSSSDETRPTTADGVVSTEHAVLAAEQFPSDTAEDGSNETHISTPASSQRASSINPRRGTSTRSLVNALSPSRPSSPPPAGQASKERSRTWFKVSFFRPFR